METRRSQDSGFKMVYWNEGVLYLDRDHQQVQPGIEAYRNGNWALTIGAVIFVLSAGFLISNKRHRSASATEPDLSSLIASRELLLRACREALDECSRARESGHVPGKSFVSWLGDVIHASEGNDPSNRWGVGTGNTRAGPIQADLKHV